MSKSLKRVPGDRCPSVNVKPGPHFLGAWTRLLLFGTIMLVTLPVKASVTLLQHASLNAGSTSSGTLAFGANNTAGDWIAVSIRSGVANQGLTVTDTIGNTYHQAIQLNMTVDVDTLAIFYAENIKGGANAVTVTGAITGTIRFAILEYAGVATSNSLDGTASGQGIGTVANSGSTTTAGTGDLLLGAIVAADPENLTAGSGYAAEESVPAEPNSKLLTEDQLQPTAGAASASGTLGGSDPWGAALAAFKAASGVAPPPAPNISGLSSSSGMVGTQITITGMNFGSSPTGNRVTFGGTAATTFSSWSATSIGVTVPAGAITGFVVVTAGGLVSNGASFTVTTPAGGLVAAYAFSEGSGTTIADASGNGNTGTIVNATWSSAGKFGNALVFNGSNAWVVINDAPTLDLTTGETLEAWVDPFAIPASNCPPTNTCPWMDVIHKDSDRYYIEASSNQNQWPEAGGIFASGKQIVFGNSVLPINTWTHLALTYDSSTIRFYVNGVLVSTASETTPITTSTHPLYIGGDETMGQFFNGLIDEVRVYNVPLTQAQIQSDMNTPIVPPPPDTQPPTAPSNLTATAISNSQINLSWTASTDNVGVTGYLVERCQGAGCTNFAQIATPAGTTFGDTGLLSGTTYGYRVRATDASGNLSGYSNMAAALTLTSAPPPSWISLVQHASLNAGSTISGTLAFGANSTAGNWIAVSIRSGVSNQGLTVTDTIGNTYHRAIQLGMTVDSDTLAIFYAESIKGGANAVTVTGTIAGSMRFAILEYAGVAAANSLDGTASAQGVGTAANSGNTTTTGTGDLLLGTILSADPESLAPGSGYAAEESVPAEPNSKLMIEDQLQPAAGTASASATFGTDPWGAALAAFKSASGAAPPPGLTTTNGPLLRDTVPPNVSIVSPVSGAAVSGTISLVANASDNVAVASVQFQVDASPVGNAVTASPYVFSLDTILFSNGSHVLTALAKDTANNRTVSAPVSVTVSNQGVSTATGPLRVLAANPRYFTDGSGRAIYLTGSHTWADLVDQGTTDPPAPFDYFSFLSFLQSHNHNFFRLWAWTLPHANDAERSFATPQPWLRTGPGNASDGKPQFDLTQFDQSYFDRMRSRIITAGQAGIYVSVMLFQGSDLEYLTQSDDGDPFVSGNNVNGIACAATCPQTLPQDAAVTSVEQAYVRKVVDTVNDLGNVLYEVANEAGASYSTQWEYSIINYVKQYEAGKPQQHPVGMTFQYPDGSDDTLYASPADWISPGTRLPQQATGNKVIVNDTDHSYYWPSMEADGQAAQQAWVWENFTYGNNTLFMDPYLVVWPGRNTPGSTTTDPYWDVIRNALGRTRTYAQKMNLAAMTPQGSLSSTGFCLANGGSEYFAYQPLSNTPFTLNLAAGTYSYEWFNPSLGTVAATGFVTVKGGNTSFTPPFSGDAVLYLKM